MNIKTMISRDSFHMNRITLIIRFIFISNINIIIFTDLKFYLGANKHPLYTVKHAWR